MKLASTFPFATLLYQPDGIGPQHPASQISPGLYLVAVGDACKDLKVSAEQHDSFFHKQILSQKVTFSEDTTVTLVSHPEPDAMRMGLAATGALAMLGMAVLSLYRRRIQRVDEAVDVLASQHQRETEEIRAQANYYRADGKPPDRVEQYVVQKQLGQGGMATVFLVKDPEGHLGALKLPVQQLAADLEFRARFWREMELGAHLRHPNVVRIDYVSPPNDELPPFYVMEYLPGRTLDQIERPVPLKQACAYARQLLTALDYIHNKGVLHRDLKPSNIMLLDDGRLVIMDFGLALLTDKDRTRLTATGHVLGTPAFMAPEQITGVDVGPATDLYAVGLIVYEMVEGSLNFPQDAMALLSMKMTQGIPPMPGAHQSIPAAFESWMFQMTEIEPSARYASAQQALAALNQAVPPD